MESTARIRLRLLGRLSLAHGDDQASIRLSTRKAGGLLAYLALSHDQTATREQLATLLWGSCSDQRARQSLRQALVLLRKELPAPDYLLADTKVIRLQPGFWDVDAIEFEELSKSGDAQDLFHAATLFGGEFLSGLNIEEEGFGEWAREQQQRMQLAAARLCETFASRPELVQDGEQAIDVTERLLALDPLREDWQRIALMLYARYRGKNEALAQAEVFAAVLQRELGIAPAKETRALIETIRERDLALDRPPTDIAARKWGHTESVSAPPISLAEPRAVKVFADVREPRRRSRFPFSGSVAVALSVIGALFLGAIGLFYMQLGAIDHTANATAAATRDPRLGTAQSQAIPGGIVDPWASPRSLSKDGAMTATANKAIIPILVLPFKTFGETAGSTELLADMVTDDLTNLLSRVLFMRVISRQTALTFKGQPVDVAAVGAELQVRYVLDGSIRMLGDKLRVNVELIDPKTRLPVWSARIDRETLDRNSTVDEIVGRLARELQFDISAVESARRSDDADADTLAYRGWAALTQIDLHGYKQAESYFRQALERDPQNLSAELGLGAYHARIGVHILDDEPDAHREKARDILQDVIRRDPRSSIAYEYLGLTLGYLRTLPQSVEAYERAIELDPSNASAHAHIGFALARTGRPAEGLVHIRYAMRLSPRDPIMPAWFEFVGYTELELNQLEQAAGDFRRSTELNPGYPRAWAGLAAAHALAGRTSEARGDVERLKTFAPTLDAQALLDRFGRHKASREHEGLKLALGIREAASGSVQTSARVTPHPEINQ